MSFDPLLIEIKATDNGYTAAIVKAQSQIKNFENETNRSLTSISNTLGSLRRQVLAFASVWGVFRIGKGFFDAGMQMQTMSNRMLAASGNADVASEAMKYASDTAHRLSLDLIATTNGYADFSASALRAGLTVQQTKTIFTGASEASTALHLSAERTQYVFMALSQMASKGRVMMEELSQQLGDSLPGALATFAQAMGKTVPEFIQMISQGKVLVPDLIKLGDELHRQFGDRAVAAAKSAQGAVNDFKNAMFEMQVKVAQDGFLDTVTASLRQFTAQLNDPATVEGLKAFAEYLGEIVVVATKAASAVGNVLTYFRDRQTAMAELRKEGKGLLFFNEDQIQDKVQTIQLRRQVINAPYPGADKPTPSSIENYSLGKISSLGISAAAQKAADMRQQLRSRVDEQNSGLITEQDPNKVDSAQAMASLNKRYAEEQDLLEKALKKKAITDQEFKEDSLKLELDYQARLAEVRKQYRDDFLSDEQAFAEGFLGVQFSMQDKSVSEQGQSFRQSIQQAAQYNKTFFEIEKVAAIASATLKGYQSVVDAYQFGTSIGGPLLGAAFAATAAAAQAANISKIASTSFGGGGGVSASGGGGGSSSAISTSGQGQSSAPTQQKSIYINLQGDDTAFYSRNSIRKLIESINDAVGDGTRLAVS